MSHFDFQKVFYFFEQDSSFVSCKTTNLAFAKE